MHHLFPELGKNIMKQPFSILKWKIFILSPCNSVNLQINNSKYQWVAKKSITDPFFEYYLIQSSKIQNMMPKIYHYKELLGMCTKKFWIWWIMLPNVNLLFDKYNM